MNVHCRRTHKQTESSTPPQGSGLGTWIVPSNFTTVCALIREGVNRHQRAFENLVDLSVYPSSILQ